MKFMWIAVIAVIAGSAGSLYAEEAKTKGLDVVSDAAVAVIKKTDAFFNGNLEWTMSSDKGVYKNDYTIDALGRRVPRSTLGKYDSGVR